jgi:hypothetical protein
MDLASVEDDMFDDDMFDDDEIDNAYEQFSDWEQDHIYLLIEIKEKLSRQPAVKNLKTKSLSKLGRDYLALEWALNVLLEMEDIDD